MVGADGKIAGGCPNWQDPKSNPVKINRKTLGWNAAAACFAYGYGKLALQGFKYRRRVESTATEVLNWLIFTCLFEIRYAESCCTRRAGTWATIS